MSLSQGVSKVCQKDDYLVLNLILTNLDLVVIVAVDFRLRYVDRDF